MFYTINQMSDEIGVPFYRVRYIIQRDHIQPAISTGNVRLYSADTLKLIKSKLA